MVSWRWLAVNLVSKVYPWPGQHATCLPGRDYCTTTRVYFKKKVLFLFFSMLFFFGRRVNLENQASRSIVASKRTEALFFIGQFYSGMRSFVCYLRFLRSAWQRDYVVNYVSRGEPRPWSADWELKWSRSAFQTPCHAANSWMSFVTVWFRGPTWQRERYIITWKISFRGLRVVRKAL